MTRARFKVVSAGPLVSLQDAGRPGYLRFGVAASGPMDRFAHTAAQTMLGNPVGGTAIEVSLGGLVLECLEGEVSLAVAGGGFRTSVDGAVRDGWTVQTVGPGARISISGGTWGSWCYLAFAGQIAARTWLGASATHTLSGLGGGAIATGDTIVIEDAGVRASRAGDYDVPEFARPTDVVRVVAGPQDGRFVPGSLDTLCDGTYKVTEAYNRMGMRLQGAGLAIADALSIPSEPIVRGSIQVAGDGVPVILLADHQTTGGYPKIATVISADLDRLTQHRSGAALRFRIVSAEDAVATARRHAADRTDALNQIAAPRLTMEDRLNRENLISGAIAE